MHRNSQHRPAQHPTLRLPRVFAGLAAVIAALPTLAQPVAAQSPAPDPVVWGGDARWGYFNLERRDRNGEVVETDDFRLRLRAGPTLRLGALEAKIRVAGRFSTEQETFSFFVRDHASTVDGLALGEATLDEAYLGYRPSERWRVRLGRMQTKAALVDLTGKSLDRGDSPNTEVSWTDGLQVTYSGPRGWTPQVILQHNASSGATNVLRPPLDVSDSRSRVTVFAGLENTRPWGPVVQRALDLTVVPGALPTAGAESGRDYVGLVARGAVAWPAVREGGRILLGGEIGHAPNTPARAGVRLGEAGSGDVGGTAFQVAVTLADLVPRHRVGVVYGRAEAGWLLSPDFRNNDTLLEGRYQWAFSRNHSFEGRLRQRRDLEQLVNTGRKREDVDFYLRISSRF